MKPLPLTKTMLDVATRVIWFEPPETALADPVRFIAYAMKDALPADMAARRAFMPLARHVRYHGGKQAF